MKCNFIGIGVQKAATTWVYSVLEDHPDVSVSFPKELDFFSREQNYFRGESWYHSHFDFTDSSKIAHGEISPSYMHHTLSPFRVHEYNKDIKIVVTLRDPIERAFSNHLHLIRWDVVKGKDLSFEYGLERFQMYIEQSRYYTILKPWFDLFGKQNVLVLLQEEINQNPKENAKRLYKFLEIDTEFTSINLTKRANQSNMVRYKLLETIFRQSAQFANSLGLGKPIAKIKKNKFIKTLRTRDVHVANTIPRMRESTESALKDTLSEEMIKLEGLLDRKKFPWKTWEYAKDNELQGTKVAK